MLFVAKSGQAVDLTTKIVGATDPRAVAKFTLNQISPAALVSSSPGMVSKYTFSVPNQPSGTLVALMLDTFPAFGAASADVFADAAQGGATLPNQNPDPNHSTDWIDTATTSGVMFSDALYVYFQ